MGVLERQRKRFFSNDWRKAMVATNPAFAPDHCGARDARRFGRQHRSSLTAMRTAMPPARRRRLLGMAAALAMVLTMAAVMTQAAQAQTYTVIHNFTGGPDGAMPMAGLTMDPAGNFYGTANFGGNTGGNCGTAGCGLVYRLTNRNSGWVLTPLYKFAGGNDGANPQIAYVVIASDGSLYSTTYYGGGTCDGVGCGTVFKLQPEASPCPNVLCPWMETVLHSFNGSDGAGPVGAMVFDQAGDLYGVTTAGGFRDGGTVYQLNASGGWNENIIFNPYGYPGSGVTMDHAGNLYGSTFNGGNDSFGSVYELTPSGSNWIETDLYDFTNGSDGSYLWAGVIFDPEGNLYGATTAGGSGQGGTAFELMPSNGNWIHSTLYSFAGPGNGRLVVGPIGSLAMDTAGNLYGTTFSDGAHGYGAVFKLTLSNGSWTYTSLHDFTNGSDGGYPYSTLILDANGNLYGTASSGGAQGLGVVFEITP
jgi:uncharacterized repeat protein (TIGR03803 family)